MMPRSHADLVAEQSQSPSATSALAASWRRSLLKHGLDDFVRATHLYRPLRFVFYLSPGMWFVRQGYMG